MFIISLSLGATPAATTLTRKRPSAELLSLYNLTLCAGFITLTFLAQAGVFLRSRTIVGYNPADPGYIPPPPDAEGLNSATPETTAVFLVAMFQYVAVAVIFSLGWPWLRPPWTNTPFSVWIAIASLVSALVLLSQNEVARNVLNLVYRPPAWNNEILVWSIGSVASYALFIAGLSALRRRGVFAAIVRAARRARRRGLCGGCLRRCRGDRSPPISPSDLDDVALHKRVTRAWATQFAGGRAAAKARSLGDIVFKGDSRERFAVGGGEGGVAVSPSPLVRMQQQQQRQ